MHDWQFFSELRHLIHHDPVGRGLDRIPCRSPFSFSAPDLQPACHSLASTRQLEVAIVTGFYIPRAECYETDGPLGAVFLAETLHQMGAGVTILSESGCTSVLEVALRLANLEDHVRLDDLPLTNPADFERWTSAFWERNHHLTHLISIERVGPSHTLASLTQQYGSQVAPFGEFARTVDAADWNRSYNMRGQELSAFTAPAHRLFETMPSHVASIGIADGGNEIGMGRLPWDVIAGNIQHGGKIACRVPTQRLIVSGVSNWARHALAAGTAWLKQCEELSKLFDSDREAQLWEATLEKEPLVDGVTAENILTVDGLTWNVYRQPMAAMQELLRRRRSVEHGLSRFPSVHG
ncbi:MAG: DUF4392 domain-containing protein [Gemmatales bacterium]